MLFGGDLVQEQAGGLDHNVSADLTPLLLGDPDPEIGADERARADAEGDEVVDEAIRTLL